MSTPGRRILRAIILIALVPPLIASCAGGGDADREELDELRSRAATVYSLREQEQIVAAALGIASRRARTAVGNEAFVFAEETFLGLDLYDEPGPDNPFSGRAPAVPDYEGTDLGLEEYRYYEGFLLTVPEPYHADGVEAQLRARILEHADFQLFRLRETLENRGEWVEALNRSNTYSGSYTGTTETEFDEELVIATYLAELAERTGEPLSVARAFAALQNALTLARFAPSPASVEYRDGTIVSTYTAEAVQLAAENVAALSEATEDAGDACAAIPGWQYISGH